MTNGQKVIVACSSCAVQYNVATLNPGAKFKCQKCGTINAVPAPAAPVQAAPVRPQPRPTVPAGRPAFKGAKPPTAIRPPVKGMGIRASGLKKGLPGRNPAGDSGDDGMSGLEVKKKSKMPIFIGIGIGVVILVVIIIALSSGGGNSAEEEAKIKKIEQEAKEKEKAEAEEAEKAAQKAEEERKAAEEKPAPEMRTEPPEAKKPAKSAKPKIKDDIDEAIKAEIEPILKDMRNQRDVDPSKEKIIAKGKKAMPILIEAIGGADDWAAMYAYEMLLKMTKRNPDDTQKVSQMIGKDARIDCQKDWEEWWFKNKDSIPD